MEGDAQKKDDEAMEKERIKKSFDKQVERREAVVAKEASFERKAQFLTRHFMKEYEQKQYQRTEDLRQASQMSYDRSMQRRHDGAASEQMLKDMVKEEKSQISQLINLRLQQREREAQEQKDKEDQRKYYREARAVHDKLQSEERHRKVAEREQQRKNEIEERMQSHSARAKELFDTKSQAQDASIQKFEANIAKVQELKKKQDYQRRKDMHERWTYHAEKEHSARESRNKDAEEKRQRLQEKEEARRRMVEAKLEAEELQQIELAKRIAHKGTGGGRPHLSPRHEAYSREPRETIASVGADVKKSQQEENNEQKGDDARKDRGERALHDKPGVRPGRSQDLVDFSAQVQKDYFVRVMDVDEARHKMHVNKRFKAVADGASGMEADLRVGRLKSVYQDLVAPKTKEPREDVPISTRGAQRPVARPPKTTACGLCEREFTSDHLVGSALRQTVEKMRYLNPKLSRVPMSAREKPSANRSHDDAADAHAPRSSPQATTHRGDKQSLYDYEVRLCVNCDIFLRIAST